MAKPMAAADLVRRHLRETVEVQRLTADRCAEAVAEAAARCSTALRAGGKLLFCGNGGSAADSQHLAAEFVSALSHDRPRPALAALALTTDTSFLTANANDFGFEQVFGRQVEALGRPGDVLIALSTSGNSPNIVHALHVARTRGLVTVLFTGESGGKALPLADVAVRVPSGDTQHIQEAHIALGHCLCAVVEGGAGPEASPR
jgi:D-sedoheptulose 7-phosphate isomerase